MSINGLTEQFIPLSINGLTSVNASSITINGVPIDPSLYVPYVSAISNVNIQPFNLSVNNVLATGNITGNALITLDTTATNSYQFKINDGSKRLELYYSGAVVSFWDRFGDYYLGDRLVHFNNFSLSSYTNNFYISYNSTNVFYLDQYGNLYANQGLYFSGSSDHYIGNSGASNIVFSLPTAQKVSFLTNSIERAYINSSGLNSNASLNLYDTASSNYWSLNTDPSTFRLNIAYDSSLVGYITNGGLFNINSITYSGTLNGISTTVFSYLSGTTSNIQAQLNAINISNYITKTGANNGINCFLNLSSTGTVNISDVSLTSLFSVGSGGSTFVRNMTSTSQINSIPASYYDPTSSIQTQLNTINSSYIAKTGTTNSCNPYIVLTNGGNFQVVDHTGTAPLFTVADTGGLVSFGQFQVNVNNINNLFASNTIFNVNSSYGYKFNFGGSTRYTFNGTNSSLQGSTSFYDSTGSLTCNISGEVQSTLNPAGGGLAQFRLISSSSLYGCIFRNDGNGTYLLFTALADTLGAWTSLRPFYITNSTGLLSSQNGQNFNGGLQTDTITTNAMGQVSSSLIVRTTSVAGANSAMLIGSASSTNNTGTVNWNYTSSGSTSNNLGIGVYGTDSVLQVYSNQVSINKNLYGIFVEPPARQSYVLTQSTQGLLGQVYNTEFTQVGINVNVAWTSGYSQTLVTKKNNYSAISVCGCVSFYSPGSYSSFNVILNNTTTGFNYSYTFSTYINTSVSHLCQGFCIPSIVLPGGTYGITFQNNSNTNSDVNDYIRCQCLVSP